MSAPIPAPPAGNHLADGRPVCPSCARPLSRVPRRLIDRLSSLLQPVQRYRCRNPNCEWVGNLPAKGRPSEPTDRGAL